MSIKIENVSYTYSRNTVFARPGLKDINLQVDQGEWIAIMGPSGSGKSTLLQHMNGLLKPQQGNVFVDGVDIHRSKDMLKEAAKKIGLVFQYPEHQLFGATIREEISYAPENFGVEQSLIEDIVKGAMTSVGLEYNKYIDRSPQELSGGEKRRLALAAVLAANPTVLALDEPTAGLDYAGRKRLLKTIAQLNKELGISIVWVTHEITDLVDFVDRIVIINHGSIAFDGRAKDALYSPLMRKLALDTPLAVEATERLRELDWEIEGRPLNNHEFIKQIGKVLI